MDIIVENYFKLKFKYSKNIYTILLLITISYFLFFIILDKDIYLLSNFFTKKMKGIDNIQIIYIRLLFLSSVLIGFFILKQMSRLSFLNMNDEIKIIDKLFFMQVSFGVCCNLVSITGILLFFITKTKDDFYIFFFISIIFYIFFKPKIVFWEKILEKSQCHC